MTSTSTTTPCLWMEFDGRPDPHTLEGAALIYALVANMFPGDWVDLP